MKMEDFVIGCLIAGVAALFAFILFSLWQSDPYAAASASLVPVFGLLYALRKARNDQGSR
jgi:hypothetical protein